MRILLLILLLGIIIWPIISWITHEVRWVLLSHKIKKEDFEGPLGKRLRICQIEKRYCIEDTESRTVYLNIDNSFLWYQKGSSRSSHPYCYSYRKAKKMRRQMIKNDRLHPSERLSHKVR